MRTLIIGLFCLIIGGCYFQDEVISIDREGNIWWMVIVKPYWEYTTPEEVEEQLEAILNSMQTKGWKTRVRNKTIRANEDVIVALTGNIMTVGKETEYYKILSREKGLARIQFLSPGSGDDEVGRKIKFKNDNQAFTVSLDGVIVDSTEPVDPAVYKLNF
ncbi:hypothetical protein [Kangiella shandongensis]|uniref:hypothetical protein n=1 Tax=Kangiella shandongensis TaxID=2763258 RepID=UPI001CC188DF|nr:hypothetical protein [Kangiella shandongensis]